MSSMLKGGAFGKTGVGGLNEQAVLADVVRLGPRHRDAAVVDKCVERHRNANAATVFHVLESDSRVVIPPARRVFSL